MLWMKGEGSDATAAEHAETTATEHDKQGQEGTEDE